MNFEDLVQTFEDLFQLSDEELERAKPVIIDELSQSLTGANAIIAIDEYLRICDLAAYTPEQYQADLETGKAECFRVISQIKENYASSAIKTEILDMTYSLVETYFGMVALRVAGRENPTVGIEFVHPNAKLPTYAHSGDQGADIYAVEDITIQPHAHGFMVPTGLKMLIPYGWAIGIRPRSGMSKNTPLRISNAPATIDQQYRGEVRILFDNLSDQPFEIKAGDRIAQFILEKNYHATYEQVDTVEPTTERGEGGFGSSGK